MRPITTSGARVWNPRYIAYARAHGHEPGDQFAHDKTERPAGCMTGFILWISQAWRDFEIETGQKLPVVDSRGIQLPIGVGVKGLSFSYLTSIENPVRCGYDNNEGNKHESQE